MNSNLELSIATMDQERLALLDMQTRHEQELRAPELGGGMSIAEKASAIDSQNAAAFLENLSNQDRAEYSPEDLVYEPWYFDDPSNTLEHVFMRQRLETDSLGNGTSVPVVQLIRSEQPLREADLELAKTGIITRRRLKTDIPMAKVVGDGYLIPEDEFTDGDVQKGLEMIAELRRAKEEGVVPHLGRESLSRIVDPRFDAHIAAHPNLFESY